MTQIAKQDIEACSRLFCGMMGIEPDDEHPSGILNWQVAADRYKEMLAMNEAMRQHLANRQQELEDKLRETATKDQSSQN